MKSSIADPSIFPATAPSPHPNHSSPVWADLVSQKVAALGQLPRGWDSYDGMPLNSTSRDAVEKALEWLKHLDLPLPGVVLGSNGGISLEWRMGNRELEIGFETNGTLEFVKVDEHGHTEEGQAADDLRSTLIKLIEWMSR